MAARLHGSCRLVLVPSKYEPEDLFRHRLQVERVMSLEGMDHAIAAARLRQAVLSFRGG